MTAALVGLGTVAPVAANASTTASPSVAAASFMRGTHLETGLHGSRSYPHAGGHASYESRPGHRELHVRMWDIRRLHGRILVVYVHGVKAGSMRVTRSGDAFLSRHHGVPACRAGQRVQVKTTGGKLVGSGTFRGHHHRMR
ncbi:MAG TPA: hypothetical protein VF162_09280 [Streptosporangiaceae bacterium]